MSPGRRDALAMRLAETLEQQKWMQCAILLAVLVRSDLEPVILNEDDYREIEQLAERASTSNRLDAPEAAGMTARLGRVLLNQLHRIAHELSIAAAAGGGRDRERARAWPFVSGEKVAHNSSSGGSRKESCEHVTLINARSKTDPRVCPVAAHAPRAHARAHKWPRPTPRQPQEYEAGQRPFGRTAAWTRRCPCRKLDDGAAPPA